MNNFNIQLFAETPLNSTTTMTPEQNRESLNIYFSY